MWKHSHTHRRQEDQARLRTNGLGPTGTGRPAVTAGGCSQEMDCQGHLHMVGGQEWPVCRPAQTQDLRGTRKGVFPGVPCKQLAKVKGLRNSLCDMDLGQLSRQVGEKDGGQGDSGQELDRAEWPPTSGPSWVWTVGLDVPLCPTVSPVADQASETTRN